jgi:hypothetical protein
VPNDRYTKQEQFSLGQIDRQVKHGDPQRAIEMHHDLIAEMGRSRGPTDEITLGTRNRLAVLLNALGRSEDAETEWRAIDSVFADLGGAISPIALIVRRHLIRSRAERGELVGLLEDLKVLIAESAALLGPESPVTAAMRQTSIDVGDRILRDESTIQPKLAYPELRDRAENLGWLGRSEEGNEAWRDVIDALQAAEIADDSPEMLEARYQAAEATHVLGDSKTALSELNLMLPDQIRIHGESSIEATSTHHCVALCLDALGRQDEAIAAFQAALETSEAGTGELAWATLTVLENLASCLERTGRLDEAKGCFSDLVSRRIANSGGEDLETLVARRRLTRVLTDMHSPNAPGDWERLIADCERILGPDHWETMFARSGLKFSTSTGDDWAIGLDGDLSDFEYFSNGPDHSVLIRRPRAGGEVEWFRGKNDWVPVHFPELTDPKRTSANGFRRSAIGIAASIIGGNPLEPLDVHGGPYDGGDN